MNDFNAFERAIIDWLREAYSGTAIAVQLQTATFLTREYTGSGFFVRFQVDPSTPKSDVTRGNRKWPQDGPVIKSSQIEHDAGSLLWGDDSDHASCIEIYANANTIPQCVTEFRLLTWEQLGREMK